MKGYTFEEPKVRDYILVGCSNCRSTWWVVDDTLPLTVYIYKACSNCYDGECERFKDPRPQTVNLRCPAPKCERCNIDISPQNGSAYDTIHGVQFFCVHCYNTILQGEDDVPPAAHPR